MATETRKPENKSSKEKKIELSFQPLSAGLGFHPFSDGLPYAPVVKNQMSQGSGAVAAGPAKFVAQLPQVSKAVPSSPAVATPFVAQVPVVPTQPALSALKEELSAEPLFETQFGLGYLLKRVLAYVVDTSVNLTLCIGALAYALTKQSLSPDALINPGVILIVAIFLLFFNWALITAQEVAFGTSAGKRLFRLMLDGPSSTILLRAFFFIPSSAFCGLGLLWALFSNKRRCWHDTASGLQPIEIARL